MNDKAPVLFVAHGAPPLLDDEPWVGELGAWARAMAKPKNVLMVSAHWESSPLAIGATSTRELTYDFYGFPQRYYEVKYPSPGAPELAARVRELVHASGQATRESPERGLDHGAFVPLLCMYPEADVPVLQVSMPTEDPRALFELGRALAPLRDEGTMIIGSGFITHNLRAIGAHRPSWAVEFDAWTADVLSRHDVDALLDYRSRAPGVKQSLPTHEHYVPLILAAGAADLAQKNVQVTFPVTGWAFGAFTKRSVQLD